MTGTVSTYVRRHNPPTSPHGLFGEEDKHGASINVQLYLQAGTQTAMVMSDA